MILALMYVASFVPAGCGADEHTKLVSSFQGRWNAVAVQFSNPLGQHGYFRVPDFGYGALVLSADSSFEVDMAVVRDVVMTSKALGQRIDKVIVKSGFRSLRTGTYRMGDSTIDFYMAGSDQIWRTECFMHQDNLEFIWNDKEHNTWTAYWEKSS